MTEISLAIDLNGRLRNFKLPPSRSLVPIYESIMNSIHAIQDTPHGGDIRIEVIRGSSASTLVPEQPPIVGFRIKDNGIGFNDNNFKSFCTSDSTFKFNVGGKGVGRFSWLKVFRDVEIESVYQENGKSYKIAFSFSGAKGISVNRKEELNNDEQSYTIVSLQNINDVYRSSIPKSINTISHHIAGHCLMAIKSVEKKLNIDITDPHDSSRFDINSIVDSVFSKSTKSEFVIERVKFKLTYIRVSFPELSGNRVLFLAHKREVRNERIGNLIPVLSKKLTDNSEQFWIWILVESKYLDDYVTPERDSFFIPETKNEDDLDLMISISDIKEKLKPQVIKDLDPYLSEIKTEHINKVNQYVQNKAPEYRYLIRVKPDLLDSIKPDLPEEKLDMELNRVRFEIETKHKESANKILNQSVINSEAYKKLIDDENIIGKTKLATYVVHRRMILDLFKKQLSAIVLDPNNTNNAPAGDTTEKQKSEFSYQWEKVIHDIVIPMKTTSDEIFFEKQNLWLIDERLAFHYYLASDKELNELKPIVSTSDSRPDIVSFHEQLDGSIYDNPSAFVVEENPPFNSISIVEFKRPMRNQYNDEENPIRQVLNYVKKIKNSQAFTKNGRPVDISPSTGFYCYIVCDITNNVKNQIAMYDLISTIDGSGYFGYNKTLNAWIEVISFNKIIADAEKRNRIFFDKLGIHKF